MTVVSSLKQIHTLYSSFITLAVVTASIIFTSTQATATEGDNRWFQIKSSLIGDSHIQDGQEILGLDTPKRAMDAAIVPITIESKFEQSSDRFIKKLYIVIDNNPSPVAAVFTFPGNHNWKSLSTRVRINAYTDLRAIAEISDGNLYMVNNYVKASGGCSAPSLKDPAAAAAQLGLIKFRLPESFAAGDLVPTQLMIKHPNNSGLQFDQISRYYIPADFVRTIQVTYNGEEVFTVDTDISISEDPSIRFGFAPDKSGVLEVHVKDSKGRTFTHSMSLPEQRS
ncbi:MAG: quinoprotein dehydrogenase-associated SoxYZ-like carrier [Candidatus Thiodiazotropha taylori]|nr:quinoprotein dehydrogenase-associated SoxYZ-like carrier [Candidatus Thiodiazotropha taylori]